MTAETSTWDAYVGAVIRIEALGGVFWVRPAPVTRTTGEYPDPDRHAIYVLTAHHRSENRDCTTRAQQDARGAVSEGEANYAVAFERLFAAVARLNPLYGADVIRTLGQSWVT